MIPPSVPRAATADSAWDAMASESRPSGLCTSRTEKPAAANTGSSSAAAGRTARAGPHTPPASMARKEGFVAGTVAYARSKSVASVTRPSRCGVVGRSVKPYAPTWSARRESAVTTSTGRAGRAGEGTVVSGVEGGAHAPGVQGSASPPPSKWDRPSPSKSVADHASRRSFSPMADRPRRARRVSGEAATGRKVEIRQAAPATCRALPPSRGLGSAWCKAAAVPAVAAAARARCRLG